MHPENHSTAATGGDQDVCSTAATARICSFFPEQILRFEQTRFVRTGTPPCTSVI